MSNLIWKKCQHQKLKTFCLKTKRKSTKLILAQAQQCRAQVILHIIISREINNAELLPHYIFSQVFWMNLTAVVIYISNDRCENITRKWEKSICFFQKSSSNCHRRKTISNLFIILNWFLQVDIGKLTFCSYSGFYQNLSLNPFKPAYTVQFGEFYDRNSNITFFHINKLKWSI